ncbi:TetR/AcrR family transcriptional regulator [Paenibacillus arenilitoris]|uniref:TetR/AcrR family transcriptional regulator n=1 Tax=Paenibacillus arenilitoris TaxID=2772299 RepID=A0A927CGT7_9BACL|nr:TetR/AcrR family transcriptional regulator [Paenibacillus arenilitoris]MBD2867285.1 TetR/AcrR family transcriptional regulator [Paenibacillus arenilitoris]
MPRTKEQYEEMRNATKQKIEAAAMHLFVHKGFGATSVQDIADRAGISIGLLYRHYKTKESLFRELAEFALAGLNRMIAMFESDGSPKEMIGRFVDEIYNDMTTGEELANLLILMAESILSEGGSEPGEAARLSGKMFQATSGMIEKGQALGQFRPGDPLELALYFYSALHGLAVMKVTLKSGFVMPSPSILTAFLFKEGE